MTLASILLLSLLLGLAIPTLSALAQIRAHGKLLRPEPKDDEVMSHE